MANISVKVNACTNVLQEPTASQFYLANPNGLPSVKLFGAVADGVTDDTAAINAAIAAGPVFFPVGSNQSSASNVLTASGNFSNGETIVIGTPLVLQTYTAKTVLASPNDFLIGATLSDSLVNAQAAVNGAFGEGSLYGSNTVANSNVYASVTATTMTITALQPGSAGNLVTTTETCSLASWATATLTGGVDSYRTTGELLIPSKRSIVIDPNAVFKRSGATVGSGQACFFRNTDYTNGNSDISITGGIFDGDCTNVTRSDSGEFINGVGFRFRTVTGLYVNGVQIRNTETFGIQGGAITDAIFENIWFNSSVPSTNQDGLHLCGPLNRIVEQNIKGNTSDDLIALNANAPTPYAMSQGDIDNVLVKGVTFNSSLGGILIVSNTNRVDNVILEDLNGIVTGKVVDISTIGMGGVGNVGNITIRNINIKPSASFPQVVCDTATDSLVIDGSNRALISDVVQGLFAQRSSNLIKNLVIKNATWIASAPASGYMVNPRNVTNLIMESVSRNYTGGGAISGGLLTTNAATAFGSLTFSNCYCENAAWAIYFPNGTAGDIKILGTTFKKYDIAFYSIGVPISALDVNGCHFDGVSGSFSAIAIQNGSYVSGGNISGCSFINTPRFIFYSGTGTATAQRWTANGNTFVSVTEPFINLNGITLNVSINSPQMPQNRVVLTPLTGDIINNTGTGPTGEIYYDGTNWHPLQSNKKNVNVISSGQTLVAASVGTQVYTGSGSTWVLPAMSTALGVEFQIFNRGSGAITLNRAGSDNIYEMGGGGSVTTTSIAAGAASTVFNDGSFWIVETT